MTQVQGVSHCPFCARAAQTAVASLFFALSKRYRDLVESIHCLRISKVMSGRAPWMWWDIQSAGLWIQLAETV
jgi:hypothetical protein